MQKVSASPRSLDRGPLASPEPTAVHAGCCLGHGNRDRGARPSAAQLWACFSRSSCPTLRDPWTAGPSVHGISQTRMLEWVAISFSRGSSQRGDRTCTPALQAYSSPLSHCGSPRSAAVPQAAMELCRQDRQSMTTLTSSRALGGSAPGSLQHLSSETPRTLVSARTHKCAPSTTAYMLTTAHALSKGKSLFKSAAHLPKKCL